MRKIFRKIIITFGSIFLVFVILVEIWMWYSRRGHPKTSGTIRVEGLTAPVEVYRDKDGIPHIYARTEEDLFFAQGFVHAQDRFWQMEFWRRIGSGRLSELFGEDVLGTDIYLRTLGFARLAEQEYEMYEDEYKRILDAYAAGVNAYILDRNPSKLGIEFALLKLMHVEFEIEPWTPVNTLTWIKVMAHDLGDNMEDELTNIDRIRTVGISLASDFDIPYRDDEMPYIISDEEMGFTSEERHARDPVSLSKEQVMFITQTGTRIVGGFDMGKGLVFGRDRGIGSNNWVISGALTSTGTPLLANDTHLGVDMPSVWYEIGLHCTGNEGKAGKIEDCALNVRGFSFPGFPGVIVGHNERIAWGVTTLTSDVQDLYIERINPENPNQYEVNGHWVDMEILYEHIDIHDEDEPYGMLVRMTRHGPIVTDHGFMLDYSNFGITPQRPFPENLEFTALSLRWTALQPNNSLKAVIKLNHARNFDEFREALSYWDTPAQNFVYADIDGNIGYQAPGLTPIRAKGDGYVPAPGWTDEYEWTGFIPFDEMPYVYNPAKGYIVTANNPVVSNKYPYMIARWTGAAYRAKRIVDMIEEEKDSISIEDIQRMQADHLNLPPLELLPYLEPIAFKDAALESARELLLDWDAQMDMNSPRAALYGYFYQKLIEKTFKDQLIEKLWPPGGPVDSLVCLILQDPDSRWWDDITTPEVVETRDDILSTVFEKAYAKAVEELGDKPEKWKWGDVFTVTFRNKTFGESGIRPIEAIFNRGPFSLNGGITQVNQAFWDYDEPFEVKVIATLRQIIDLGDFSNSLMMHTTGQSGHPTNRHYDDFIEQWRDVQYHPTLWERKDVEKNVKKKLILKPAS